MWCFGSQLLEAQKRERLVARALVGVYTTGTCLHGSKLPTWSTRLVAGLLGNTDLVFFLNDSQHAEYFNLFCITPLESIYQLLISMDYQDIWYSTKVLQGLFSRFCGLYAFYFLAMCSRGVPLGIIPVAFQWYDFAYNEAQIRRLLIYTCIYTATATINCH